MEMKLPICHDYHAALFATLAEVAVHFAVAKEDGKVWEEMTDDELAKWALRAFVRADAYGLRRIRG